ncbi:MAG: hypothetical protein IJS62_05760 [Bacteroidales bacterium]|nr:hypothetical protein [Bacteroidales bacterium]
MNYRYRVTLSGIKGFYRLYTVNGENTLYTFHKQLQADLEFPADQQILFKAFDAAGAVKARYALIDIGDGTVDSVSIARTVKEGVACFVYFYDVASRKSVIITLEGEDAGEHGARPVLLESKGPVPEAFENGYVAFEDLPAEQRHLPGERPDDEDDDDDFEEEEDDDGEEEEVIYDANE